MTASFTIGVDPGGRETGIVTVHRDEPLTAKVLVRAGTDDMPGLLYLEQVLTEIADQAAAATLFTGARTWSVAVEGVKRPNPNVKRRDGNSLTDPTGIIGTAIVLGAVLARYGHLAVLVPPGGNGTARSIHLYPVILRPATGRGKGHDLLRHARSAFDVALAARWHAALARQNRNDFTPNPEAPAS